MATRRPFSCDIFRSTCRGFAPGVITEQNTDDLRDAHWWLPTIETTRKSAAEIGEALRPLLLDAEKKRFRDTFAEIVRQATLVPRAVSSSPVITLVTGVDRLFQDWENPTNEEEQKKRQREESRAAAHIRDLAARHLRPIVPAGVTVRIVVLRKSPGGDPLHNRFVLTNVGGVVVPYGVDDCDREEGHNAKDDLLPMPRGMYQERWAQYVKLKGGEVVLGPELIASTE